MSKLFKDDGSDSEELNINNDYATNYDTWRQKEELHKLKARYGEDVEILANSEEDDSSETSEDDEGEEIPEEFEKSFYKTLACLKNKDPRIYNENVKFFEEIDTKPVENDSIKKKEKSLFLRDYERKIIVERGGKLSDESEDEDKAETKSRNPTYVQEQREIKESFKKALQEEDNGEDLLFKPKTKSKEEAQKEEEDYKEWLKGQKKDINDEEKKDLEPLKNFWTDPNLDSSEKFLRDYILNKKFLDKESANDDLDYEHVIHDSDDNLSEDEKNIKQQEEFEHKYNFRFEEPDQEFIKRYPRTLENSLRKKDTRRAEKRAEIKARKEQEKLKKKEELKELKALKRKEIEEKLEKLKEITGNDDLQLNMMDLEGDFDPDEYDRKMNQIFNDNYYNEGEEEQMKPEFPDIDEELNVEPTWDNYDPETDEIIQDDIPYHDVPHCEDPEFNMDADYNGQKDLQSELVESTKKKKKRRRTKFAEMISKEKPKFDPSLHSSYKEYYDQYYALDYEDMIGDLPCRFKYREVVPNDYGLTVEEILMADDKELNKWCSLKRALQYQPEHKELNDVKTYKQKATNEALKKKVLKSLYSQLEEDTETPAVNNSQTISDPQKLEQEGKKKKRKRRKKNQQNEETKINTNENVNNQESSNNSTSTEKVSKKKKDRKESVGENPIKSTVKESALVAEGESTNKQKRKNEDHTQENGETETVEKKKKKKTQENNLSTEYANSNGKSMSIVSKQPTIDQTSNAQSETVEKKKKKKTQESNLSTEYANSNGKSMSIVSKQPTIDQTSNDQSEKSKKKKKKSKEKSSEKNNESSNTTNNNVTEQSSKAQLGEVTKKAKNKNKNKNNKDQSEMTKKEKRKELFKNNKVKKPKVKETDQIASLSAERLKAYGLNPKKFKNKLKYMKKN